MTSTKDLFSKIYELGTTQPISPTDIHETNPRHARELIGKLLQRGYLVETEDGDIRSVVNDTTLRQFNLWVSLTTESDSIEENLNPRRVAAKPTVTRPAKTDPTAGCLCGCGSSVNSKANYRPGHDARHAGAVARTALELSVTQNKRAAKALIKAELPTDALRNKATVIYERLLAKSTNRSESSK